MPRVDGRLKVTIDGTWSKIVHDLVVQCEVCLKTSTFKSVKIKASQLLFIR